jgi:endonuclease G
VTNNHVIPNKAAAASFSAEFLFEDDAEGNLQTPVSISLNPDGLFWTSQELDVTLVALTTSPPPSIATLSLRPNLVVAVNDHVSIIQHPEGGPKQIAVTNNRVLNLFGSFLHYFTDTLPGSSGSPVFLDSWDIVAVHRAGGQVRKNNKGDVIFANEGVLTSALLKDSGFCTALCVCHGLSSAV